MQPGSPRPVWARKSYPINKQICLQNAPGPYKRPKLTFTPIQIKESADIQATQQQKHAIIKDPPKIPSLTQTPLLSRRDPSINSIPTYSKAIDNEHNEQPDLPWRKRFTNYLYDSENNTFCSRTCDSWFKIIIYGIMYLIFLGTYTMIFLYISLLYIRKTGDKSVKVESLIYNYDKVGLSGTPLAEHNFPLISYRIAVEDDYNKYINALDELFSTKREKRDLGSHLGPCGRRPYGYGEQPCIIIRINKQLKWSGKPLTPQSPKTKTAPVEVQKWVQQDSKKFWLHCAGYHDYDKEHIGKIRYYPDPPGIDSNLFPLDMRSKSPSVAVQVSNFTLGVSLAIECNLWYENGPSSIAFVLYVSDRGR